jgi:hypothetical protein
MNALIKKISAEDIRAAIAYGAEMTRERIVDIKPDVKAARRNAKDKLLKLHGKVKWTGDLDESRVERKFW